MNRLAYLKVVKIAIGSALAMLVAQLFGVQYAASAGIITLLSIQDTKKATLKIAIKRSIAFVCSLLCAWIAYTLLGFTPFAFGLFLILFVSICLYFSLGDGISMCSVLMTHFLVEQSMSVYWVKNEIYLMIIGTSIGVLMNIYMPSSTKVIRDMQAQIEMEIRYILKGIANFLMDDTGTFKLDYDFKDIENHIEKAIGQAYTENENILSYDRKYFIDYMEMRKSQIIVLKTMCEQCHTLVSRPAQAMEISNLLDEVLRKFRETNNAKELLINLEDLKTQMKQSMLPITRQEFEDRAILYSMMNAIEQFLEFKENFADRLSEIEKRRYWA